MAHRKRHKSATTKRKTHRKMGATKSEVGYTGMLLIGGVIGNIAATAMQRAIPAASPKMMSGAQLLLGGWAAIKFASPLVKGIGFGVGTAGATSLAHEFGILRGVEGVVSGVVGPGEMYPYQLNGISNSQMLSGISNDQMLSGYPNTMGDFPTYDDEYNSGVLG